jgi:hypothetical protein
VAAEGREMVGAMAITTAAEAEAAVEGAEVKVMERAAAAFLRAVAVAVVASSLAR